MARLDKFFAPAQPGPRPPARGDATPGSAALIAILESVTDAVFVLDAQWRFAYLNPQGEALLRRSRAELLGVGIWDAFPEGRGTDFDKEYHRAVATGVAARFETYYEPLQTWVDVRAYPSAAGLICYCHDITARKREEEGRRASEARYRALLAHARDVTLIVAADGRVRYVSPVIERELGYPAASHLDTPVFDWLHADDRPRAERAFRALLARPGANGTEEVRVRHGDGGWRWVEASGTNLLADPDIAGIVINYRDSGERRAAQEALRTQYQAFPIPTHTWRLEGDDFVLIDYNAAAATLTGGKIAALLGRRRRDVYADSPAVVADFDGCRATGTPVCRELRHRMVSTGEEREFAATFVPIPPDMVMVHTEDITARKAADAALKGREALLTEAQRLAHLGGWEYDPASDALSWSDEAYRIFGLRPGEFPPTRDGFLARVHPADRPAVERAIQSALDNGGFDASYRIVRPDGEVRAIHARGELVTVDGRRRLMGAMLDITERHATEEALRRSEAGLAEAQRLAHVGSWEYDIARDTLSWSDETFRIAGYAPQAFVPTHERLLGVVHPDDRQAILGGLASSLAGVPPDSLEHRLVRPDGSVRVVRQRAKIVRDDAGRPVKQVGVMEDITAWRTLEQRLQHQATHDALTGLPNRALLLDRLGQALARSRRGTASCAVLFLDLDRFKDINDARGHDVGDLLLVAAADRLRGALREGDTLARLGGDEFVALLEPVADATEAAEIAGRLLAALATPFPLVGREERVSASVGVVLATPEHERPDDLLRDADVAMYRAKEAGRARFALFDPAMQAALTERRALERDLWVALQDDAFTLHYQPIVGLGSGAIVAVEALVRWPHPERGLIPPDRFIPLAEACGAIRPLGRWVLRAACRQGRAWLDDNPGRRPVAVAVNLSAREFQDPQLVETVAATLAETGLPAHLLRLEITESAAMGDAATALGVLGALKALGVRLSLDDFGTGYSSLAYLRRFPVDTLKIDRAFIRDLPADTRSGEIARAIATLAKTLHLEVTAEGIETAAQVAWAQEAGCDNAQGYYFARPLPPEELATRWGANAAGDRATFLLTS